MKIQEFHAKLKIDNNRSPIFSTLRKLMSLDHLHLKTLRINQGAVDFEWPQWADTTERPMSCSIVSA